MDDAPPPTDHVLRPHHITLLVVLAAAFKDLDINKFPSSFALHIHRVLLNEVAEVSQPKSHKDLLAEVLSGPSADAPQCERFRNDINMIPHNILTAEKMGGFVASTTSLCNAPKTDASEQPRFARRSIFGFFCRRCQTTFSKLSATGLLKLCRDYQAWCGGDSSAGYFIAFIAEKDELDSGLLLFKTQADKKTWARAQYFEEWQKSLVVGDETSAIENIRRFFEQHFHESSDSGYRHHALLGLIRMHYVKGEHTACRTLLTEAIDAARTTGDKVTLHHCLSILNRLPKETPGQKPNLQEIQSDLHPLEVLYDVSKLLDAKNEQPLSAAFVKIFQAIGLYDHWLDVQMALPVEEQQWAQHAVQSIVWREAGCHRLSFVEENVILALTEFGGEGSTRLSVTLNRAYEKARQGSYEDALKFLLHPSVWQGLTVQDYGSWSHEIWHILVLRTTRRGQIRMYREFLAPRRPSGTFNPKEYLFDVESDKMPPIREPLYQLLQLRERDQVTSGIDHLLTALWHAEFLCRYGLYRTGIVLLADIGLQFGMSKRSRQLIEEVMPQIIMGHDLEQRAVACFVLARCVIAAGGSTAAALTEAIPYLEMAAADFKKLEIYRSLKDVQYLMSVIYHNLGMIEQRDAAANSHLRTEEHQKSLEMITYDETYQDIFELVAKVGAALASRK